MRKPHMTVVTQADLAQKITDSFLGKYSLEEIKTIIKDLEYFTTDALLHAEKDRPVQVRLFYGLQIESEYIPEHRKIGFRGIAIDIPEKYRVRARITKYFNDKLNTLKESWTG